MNSFQIYTDIFLNWHTLLDIGLIAAALFFLYRTFLRLGTWQILVGILAAFGLFIVAHLLNLEGIEWIYRNVSHVALLGLIIIFQPEIRKIFAKVVSLTVGGTKRKQPENTASIVAQSLWELAGQKRGAIIVFPGREQILDKISGGYTLNALPSQPLIMSIFDPHSPGHDGAVIIREDLLTRFGVRLPMSSSARISDEYGTRHHAAMGMSEQTDSLVLLVSEERGRVAAFRDASMITMDSLKEIERTIESHFTSFGMVKVVRKVVASPRVFMQLACSILAAIVFWSTLILGQRQMVERTLTVPIEYTSHPEGLVLVGSRASELVVHASGPKSAIEGFVFSDPRARVNLSALSEGKQLVLFTDDNFKPPSDVKILDITPPESELTLAAIIQQTVPITPQLIGSLPKGLKLKKVELLPAELPVLAPPVRPEAKGLSLSTTPIYLNSINASSRILCKIIAPPSFQPIDRRWPDIELFLSIEEDTEQGHE